MQIARQLQKVQIMQIAGADNEYGSFPEANDRFLKVLADYLGKAALKCLKGFIGFLEEENLFF